MQGSNGVLEAWKGQITRARGARPGNLGFIMSAAGSLGGFILRRSPVEGSEGAGERDWCTPPLGRSSWSLSSGVESAAGSELDLSGVLAATA